MKTEADRKFEADGRKYLYYGSDDEWKPVTHHKREAFQPIGRYKSHKQDCICDLCDRALFEELYNCKPELAVPVNPRIEAQRHASERRHREMQESRDQALELFKRHNRFMTCRCQYCQDNENIGQEWLAEEDRKQQAAAMQRLEQSQITLDWVEQHVAKQKEREKKKLTIGKPIDWREKEAKRLRPSSH